MSSERWYNLIWTDENQIERQLQVDDDDLFGVDFSQLKKGRRIKDWDSRCLLRSSSPLSDGLPEDILCNHLALPVFSEAFRSKLGEKKIGVRDIQFLPIKVYQSTGEELSGFEIANILTRLPALDYDHSSMLDIDESEIDPETGKNTVLSVWTAALKKDVIKGHDILRLLEFFPPVFVSERFFNVFTDGGFSGGVEFSPVRVV